MTVGLLGLRSVATPKHYPTEECRIGTFHDSGLTTAVFASARKTRSETNYSRKWSPIKWVSEHFSMGLVPPYRAKTRCYVRL